MNGTVMFMQMRRSDAIIVIITSDPAIPSVRLTPVLFWVLADGFVYVRTCLEDFDGYIVPPTLAPPLDSRVPCERV